MPNDKRVRVSDDVLEALRAAKVGNQSYNDVIREALKQYEPPPQRTPADVLEDTDNDTDTDTDTDA